MIIGIGTDIIEIDRINKAINNNGDFLKKIFTDKEIEFFLERNMRYETIAGSFAAKEAFSKAVGTGFRGFSFKDIEVFRNELGKPYIRVSERVRSKINRDFNVLVSISHNKKNAISFVTIETK